MKRIEQRGSVAFEVQDSKDFIDNLSSSELRERGWSEHALLLHAHYRALVKGLTDLKDGEGHDKEHDT